MSAGMICVIVIFFFHRLCSTDSSLLYSRQNQKQIKYMRIIVYLKMRQFNYHTLCIRTHTQAYIHTYIYIYIYICQFFPSYSSFLSFSLTILFLFSLFIFIFVLFYSWDIDLTLRIDDTCFLIFDVFFPSLHFLPSTILYIFLPFSSP